MGKSRPAIIFWIFDSWKCPKILQNLQNVYFERELYHHRFYFIRHLKMHMKPLKPLRFLKKNQMTKSDPKKWTKCVGKNWQKLPKFSALNICQNLLIKVQRMTKYVALKKSNRQKYFCARRRRQNLKLAEYQQWPFSVATLSHILVGQSRVGENFWYWIVERSATNLILTK